MPTQQNSLSTKYALLTCTAKSSNCKNLTKQIAYCLQNSRQRNLLFRTEHISCKSDKVDIVVVRFPDALTVGSGSDNLTYVIEPICISSIHLQGTLSDEKVPDEELLARLLCVL